MTPQDTNTIAGDGLLQDISKLLRIPVDRIEIHKGWVDNGGDSLLALKLQNHVRSHGGSSLSVGSILQAKSLDELFGPRLGQHMLNGANHNDGNHDTLGTGESGEHLHANGNLQAAVSITTTKGQDDSKKMQQPGANFSTASKAGLPITEVQASMILYSHAMPGCATEHLVQHCYVDLLPRLKEAIRTIVMREEIIRTKFTPDSRFTVRADMGDEVAFDWEEVSFNSPEEQEEYFQKCLVGARQGPPIFRVTIPQDEQKGQRQMSTVNWFFQHALLDGQSLGILLQRIDSIMDGEPMPPSPQISFFEKIQEFRDYHESRLEEAREFWDSRGLSQPFGTIPSRVFQPDDRVSTVYSMRETCFYYPEDPKAFSFRTGFSFEVLLRAAWSLAMSKLTDSSTVVFSTVNSRRSLPIDDFDEVVGAIQTNMPMKVTLKDNDTIEDLLQQIFDEMMCLDDMSFTEQSDGYDLAQSSVISSDFHTHSPSYSGGKGTEAYMNTLMLMLYARHDGRIRISYCKSIFSEFQVKVLVDLLHSAMVALGKGSQLPGFTIKDCLANLIPNSQKLQLLKWGNCFAPDTAAEPDQPDIITLFQQHASVSPGSSEDRVAIQAVDRQIHYSELDVMTQKVAAHLKTHFSAGSVIFIHADRSVNWVVATMAVLRGGFVFAPASSDWPRDVRSQNYAVAQGQGFLVPHSDDPVETPTGCHTRLCVEDILSERK